MTQREVDFENRLLGFRFDSKFIKYYIKKLKESKKLQAIGNIFSVYTKDLTVILMEHDEIIILFIEKMKSN